MTSVRVKRRLYTELDNNTSPINRSNHLNSKLNALYGRTLHHPTRAGEASAQPNGVTESTDERDPLHEEHLIEHLEAIDPELATVENLSNAANSILMYEWHP